MSDHFVVDGEHDVQTDCMSTFSIENVFFNCNEEEKHRLEMMLIKLIFKSLYCQEKITKTEYDALILNLNRTFIIKDE